MNEKENTPYKANIRASNFLDKHDEELMGMELYLQLKAAFDAEMITIEKAKEKQFEQTKPITQIKNSLREVMAETMVKFLLRAAMASYF